MRTLESLTGTLNGYGIYLSIFSGPTHVSTLSTLSLYNDMRIKELISFLCI